MSILGRMKMAALTAATSLVMLAPGMPVHAAGTISFEYLDGTPLSATVSSSESGFAAADSEITSAGYEVVGYIYDDCRLALSDHSDISGDTRLKAVTTRDVSAKGVVGSGVNYFVYNNKLYLTGVKGSYIEGTGRNGSGTKTDTVSSTKVVVQNPEVQYGDVEGKGYGIKASEIGDEDRVEENKYFEYIPSEDLRTVVSTSSDEKITYPTRFSGSNESGIKPDEVEWKELAENITDIYISDDVALKGSMNFLFNGNKDAATMVGKVPESIYKSLKNVYLFADTSEVTSAAGMFARCPRLENVYVRQSKGALDLKKCESTAYMFFGDEKLSNGMVDDASGAMDAINVMDLSSGSLTDTAYMFADCVSIRQPNVSNYNMSGVLSAEGMFMGCTGANLLCDPASGAPYNVGTFDLSNCVNVALMFNAVVPRDAEGNALLDELTQHLGSGSVPEGSVVEGVADISAMKLTKAVTAYMMFAGNSGVTGARFGSGYPSLKSTAVMFSRCGKLMDVDMNRAQMPVLTDATGMFFGAGLDSAGGAADFSNVSMPVLKYANGMFAYTGFNAVRFDTATDCAALLEAKAMFAANDNLADLGANALSHLRLNNLEDASYMFFSDDALSTVKTKDWGMEKVKDISFMFAESPSVSDGVVLSDWRIGSSLTDMECFANGTDIQSADMSGWAPKNVTNMFMAFANNDSLADVKVPATELSALKIANGMFYNDPSLVSVSAFGACPSLTDARGMFAGDTSLAQFDGGKLVGSSVKQTAFMFLGCNALADVNLTGWDMSGAEYMEGMFLNDTALKNLKTAAQFKGSSAVNTARMFENNSSMTSEEFNTYLAKFSKTPRLADAKNMFRNMYALTELDMSGMDFANTRILSGIADMDEKSSQDANLALIRVPQSFLSCADAQTKGEDGKQISLFHVDGDEKSSEDDLMTRFYVTGGVSDKLSAYNFGGTNGDNDNRKFMVFKGRSINGEDTGIYNLANADAALKVSAETTFFVDGKPAALSYDWTKDGKDIDGTENIYRASKGGSYHVNVLPGVLTGSNTPAEASFVLGGKAEKLTATYDGVSINVGDSYAKEDVIVKLIDDTNKEYALSSNDFAVDSQVVKKVGDNQYVASYKVGAQTLTANFVVPGERHIGCIEAEYTGPSVNVGKDYGTDYVITTAYYFDDTARKDGFTVKDVTFSSTKVTKTGDNEFVVTYKDPEQGGKEFTDVITVNGFKPIKSIKAKYTGKDVQVGKNYDKKKVKVTLKYEDGTTEKTKNFKVDSTLVTIKGKNEFTATYKDPYGKEYDADFSVNGVDGSGDGGNGNGDNGNGNGDGGNSQDATPAPYDDSFTTSTVYAPNTDAADYSQYSTATGLVQTGRTTKGIVSIIACIVAAAVVAGAVFMKKRLEKEDGEEV